MPAQKRALEDPEDDLLERDRHEGPEEGYAEDSDRSPSSSNGDKDEFVMVKLSDIRKEVQCPICLGARSRKVIAVVDVPGIIRKTRTVMECLHRFCRGCIDKSMRLGNNECPACRTHCASRRSLRDDPNYDALIAAFYPDIDKYEEEELALQEEEKARNKQIQASIAQTIQRQSEALGKKGSKFVQKTRGRINRRNGSQPLGFDDNEDAYRNDGKDSSSADEHIEKKSKGFRKRGSARFSHHMTAACSAYGGGSEHNSVINREIAAPMSGLVGSPERLSWGKNGTRSHIRFGSTSNGNGKNPRNNRIAKLVDCLRMLEDNDEKSNIHLILVSLDEQMIPALKRPYLHCRPSLSVKHLCQYVALQTELQVGEVEMYMLKELHAESNPSALGNALTGQNKDKLQLLEEVDTMGELKKQSFPLGSLLLAFQKKVNLPDESMHIT